MFLSNMIPHNPPHPSTQTTVQLPCYLALSYEFINKNSFSPPHRCYNQAINASHLAISQQSISSINSDITPNLVNNHPPPLQSNSKLSYSIQSSPIFNAQLQANQRKFVALGVSVYCLRQYCRMLILLIKLISGVQQEEQNRNNCPHHSFLFCFLSIFEDCPPLSQRCPSPSPFSLYPSQPNFNTSFQGYISLVDITPLWIGYYSHPQSLHREYYDSCSSLPFCLNLTLKFYLVQQMLENDFAGLSDLHEVQVDSTRPRGRSYQIRIKQKRSELEDYELRQTIGEGGFGKVKKAIHRLTGETVAVKIATVEQYEPDQLEAIHRQIELQKNLMHENIAQIYEVIRKDNKIYIFMEFCKNGQLFEKINQNGPMAEKEAAKIFHQILSALLYLKESGLSHRDIKPQNVMFDENWNVKLIDFGFSCASHFGEFRKTICGTPSYTPPEIIKRQSYDPQLVDVWCLGVTLYAMLAAQLPFEGETNEKRKANIVSCKFQQKHFFSPRAQRLFASIFVDAKFRVKLWDLRTSEFSLNYEPTKPHFIDFKNQNLVIEDSIIEIIDKEYHVDPQKVIESVKNCRFDKYHAMYYLTLKNEKHTHKHTQLSNLDQYKKQRKGSLIKLKPIARTPSLHKKSDEKESTTYALSLKTSRVEKDGVVRMRPRKAVDVNNCRLRRDSPDSPRRLLDCLAAYKDF